MGVLICNINHHKANQAIVIFFEKSKNVFSARIHCRLNLRWCCITQEKYYYYYYYFYYCLPFLISFQNPPQTGNKCLEQTSYRFKIVKWNQLRIFIHPWVTWWLKCIKICLFWDLGFKKSYVASFFLTTITSADIALARHNIIHNRFKRIYTVALLWFK